MLAVSPLMNTRDESQREKEESLSIETCDFADLSEGTLLESINFEFDDDFFVCFDEGDVLPDLEMDPEMLAEFSLSGGEESEMNSSITVVDNINKFCDDLHDGNNIVRVEKKLQEEEKQGSSSDSGSSRGEEIVSRRDESMVVNPLPKENEKGRKSSSSSQKNNHPGKRKVKVSCYILLFVSSLLQKKSFMNYNTKHSLHHIGFHSRFRCNRPFFYSGGLDTRIAQKICTSSRAARCG